MQYHTLTLDNGIRLVHQEKNSAVAYAGVIINTGSRDEQEDQHGMAHFVEHMIFKGTRQRRAHHILSRMEDVGGEINAYTTKEETCVFTGFFNNYYPRAFELFSDILFGSVFPEREILKEKEVIIDEINSYKDSPLELIYDEFEEQVFHPHAMGRNILGTEDALNRYRQSDLIEFVRLNYPTDQMIVSSVGNLPFRKVSEYFRKYFAEHPRKELKLPRSPFRVEQTLQQRIEKEKGTYQAHCILGGLAYRNDDPKRYPLYLLNNLLGGPGMNSRLNMTLRESKGLAYNVESHFNTYSDTGLIQIYFGTDRKDLKRSIDLTRKELIKLTRIPLGYLQLARAKRQLIWQVAMSSESGESHMLGNGRSLLLFNRIESLDEVTTKIESISAAEVMETALEVLHPDRLAMLIYK